MNIVVIGSGGREHAIIQKLSESPACTALYALPGNAGMQALATCVPIAATDVPAAVAWCRGNSIDYVVVTPDDPLALGMVDALAEAGIPAFGPGRAAARIEASKAFAKQLMQKYHIPTAAFAVFDDMPAALSFLPGQAYPLVVKADGLALGKGVLICETEAEAEVAVRGMMEEGAFGDSGRRVVIEEFLTGPEVSVLAFCDGERVVPMVSSMDHKRALDGDKGPNTGGMGCIAPNPYYTPDVAAQCMESIFLPTLRAMAAEGAPFKGCLYFGLMLTPGGPRVIEYNCRFGDPETQAVLPLLQSDLPAVMQACTGGRLTADMVRFADGAAACVVLASGGYPGSYKTGFAIPTPGDIPAGAAVYYAGVKAGETGGLVTAGGRVLNAVATAPSLSEALAKAYSLAEQLRFAGAHMRGDIGQSALRAPANH